MQKRFSHLLLASSLILVLSGCASSAKTSQTAADVQPTSAAADIKPVSQTASQDVSSQEAPSDAPQTAVSTDTETPQVQEKSAEPDQTAESDTQNAQLENGDAQVAENIVDSGEAQAAQNAADSGTETVEQSSESVDYAAKRREAIANLRNGKTSDAAEFWSYVDNDPLMTRTLDEEVRPHGTNTLSALGGGSTVSLKYVDTADESAKAALKPDQDLRQTMYRSEIAYYRLCQILECSFDTPVTRPVRFSKADFEALYNASSSPKNRGYRSKFEHLIWETENGKKYLYAAYKEWISPFDGFPIEATEVWSPYLKNPQSDLPDLHKFLHRMLAAGRPADSRNLSKFEEFTQGMTTRALLQQISDMILIDYLTNNWDRFAGDINNYGANCHIQPGGLIAIDNGASFPAWHAPRVVRRLNLVQAFSRNLVKNLRMLDMDELFKRLFPNPTKEELKSIERFKERRRDALKYIDDLIAKKGEDRVLVF